LYKLCQMPVLVLAATALEAAAVVPSGSVRVVIGGLGAVNTACALTREIAANPPSLVIQAGIAGAYVPAGVPVGSVVLASEEMYGDVGVITPAGWLPADAIGIPLVEARDGQPARFNQFPCNPDLVARAAAIGGGAIARVGRFLTLAQVTGVASVGDELYRRFNALCESMEGAPAAHVCAIYGIPFLEVRGISNLVEDRNREAWRVQDAAAAAQRVVQHLLGRCDELIAAATTGARV
jgi:futalosine hydrolase